MPQIRKSAAKNLQFSVSPWHFKQPAGEPNVRQTHQETYLTLEPDQPVHPAAATNVQSKAKRPVQQHVNESKWQVRKRPAPSDDTQQATVSDVHTQQSSQEQSSDTSEDEDPSEICTSGALLQGTAVLAFLPSGQLSGHFVDKQSKKCFGIMGVQLTALRECTRDVEWKLMKITITNFDSKAECQFAAERTAADAARVQAPLQFHGDEPELAEALNGLAPSDVQLQFECHTIMDGWAADACLKVYNPQLLGQGAVVNKGPISIKGHILQHRRGLRSMAKVQQAYAAPAACDSDFDE